MLRKAPQRMVLVAKQCAIEHEANVNLHPSEQISQRRVTCIEFDTSAKIENCECVLRPYEVFLYARSATHIHSQFGSANANTHSSTHTRNPFNGFVFRTGSCLVLLETESFN